MVSGWETDSHHRNGNKFVVAWARVPHRICWHSSKQDMLAQPLVSVVSKLLEKHVYNLVWQYLEDKKLISDNQWGFCPAKSTTALLSTFHQVIQILEQGSDVALIFCRKGRILVGMLYKQFYKWADPSVLRSIYITCI